MKKICAFAIGFSWLIANAQSPVATPHSGASEKAFVAATHHTNVDERSSSLAIAPNIATPCCAQFKDLVKSALPIELFELKLNETSPTFDFGNGSQAYHLIELPEYKKPYHININNIPQAPGAFNKTEYTQIAMLIKTFDGDLKLQRSYEHSGMKKRSLGFEKTVFINPNNATEKYLLVYGDTKAAEEDSTISERTMSKSGLAITVLAAIATGGALYVPIAQDGTDRKIKISPSDKGILLIEPKGLKTN